MGRFSWIIQGAKCHHKGPYKRDTEESESEMRGRKQRERERGGDGGRGYISAFEDGGNSHKARNGGDL